MVDSRAKGARGEYLVRDMLRVATGLQFERVPNSGALEYLKGDLYVPNERNRFCIEVKNYSESPLSDKIFTAKKTNNLIRWWKKVQVQADGGGRALPGGDPGGVPGVHQAVLRSHPTRRRGVVDWPP